jgi:uncharacterized protein YndB with AHSA1/START domain
MTVTSLDKDLESLTLTLVADFDAPIERVWDLWADPRKLERWWGPPTFPATFEEHDFSPGGSVSYYMTGPEGEQPRGWWQISTIEPPQYLEFTYGFSDDDGNPATDMPVMTVQVRLTERDGGTRMEMLSAFASREDMEQILEMGGAEGLQQAVGQMDALLTE